MRKNKTRGGHRKSRRLADFASDVDMVEADLPRSERSKSKGKNRATFQTKHEDERQGRVGKNFSSTQAQPFLSGLRGSQTARGLNNATGRSKPRTHTSVAGTSSLNPFAPRGGHRNRQLSALSAVSTSLSTTQSGPWCDKCNRLNRQLHGYLLDILKTGEQAVDEWAYAVGASPDHMECEPAPERIIPEGYRRCSQQCQSCVARRVESGVGGVASPGSSGWSSGSHTTAVTGGYQHQLGMINNETQMGRGPYDQTGAGLAFTRTSPHPTPSPPGDPVNHQLVAVPEGNNNLLHARWAGPPTQMSLSLPPAQQSHPLQQPWEGSAQSRTNASHNTPADFCDHPGAETATGPSRHILLPPVFEHSGALPPTPPKESSNDEMSSRRVAPSPVHLAVGPTANGGEIQAQRPQW
ncbi:hypothetical protein VMCG_04548 [Cytospora schulzeri]|uniref:Uncharacterized protein n=1 Tax=Cytospora schulzeri TaxID=448051 RepID=A0A423WRV8_9PEZI|nr:hypothetical protein VMCG_04548 [Valsa malicola]